MRHSVSVRQQMSNTLKPITLRQGLETETLLDRDLVPVISTSHLDMSTDMARCQVEITRMSSSLDCEIKPDCFYCRPQIVCDIERGLFQSHSEVKKQ